MSPTLRLRTLLCPLLALVLVAHHAAAQDAPPLDPGQDVTLREAIQDSRRVGIAADIREPESGRLIITVGPAFATAGSREYTLSRLYLAYAAHDPARDAPPVLELYDQGRKVGEYTRNGLRLEGEVAARRAEPRTAPTAPPAPAATTAPGRGKLYLGVGVGSGLADFTCDGCDFAMSSALSGYATVGLKASGATVIGVEGSGWTKKDATSRGRILTVTGTVLTYLGEGSPVWLSAGLGLVSFRRTVGGSTVTASRLGYSGRLGLELGVVGRLSATPYAGFVSTFGQPEFKVDGEESGFKSAFNNLQFGLALTLH